MNPRPLVSVGIPTYNRPHGLRRCLEHVISQTYTNLEIIISDNCSSDPEVRTILEQSAAKDSRIQYTIQPENKGITNNFNYVLEKANGAFFLWVADDDWLDENYIEECLSKLQINNEVVLCSGVSKNYLNDKFLEIEATVSYMQERVIDRIYSYHERPQGNCFYGVYRMAVFQKCKLKHCHGQDWIFLAEIMCQGKIDFSPNTFKHTSLIDNSEYHKKAAILYNHNFIQKKFKYTNFLLTILKHTIFSLENISGTERLYLCLRILWQKKMFFFVDLKKLIF